MTEFAEGMRHMEETFGHGKDNLIALATLVQEEGESVQPAVRTVDALYEDGVFYAVTYRNTNKMRQIARNPQIAVAGCTDMFTASATGEDLGWVLDPRNAELRGRLRAAFAAWYDMANNEQDENCRILAIRLVRGILNINHWEKLYHMDFANRCMDTEE